MIQIFELANTIEKELNGDLNAIATNTCFKVHADLGDFDKAMRKRNALTIPAYIVNAGDEFGATWLSLEDGGEVLTPTVGTTYAIESDGDKKGLLYRWNGTEYIYYGTALEQQYLINGVLRSTTGEYTPVKSLNNLQSSLMLEFAVPQEKIVDAELVLSSWTENTLGEAYSLGEWSVLITPQPATVGTAKNDTPLGAMVPLMVVLTVQFIKDGLISNAVGWTLNGERITPTSIVKEISRTPDIKPRANDGVCLADNQYEAETIVMTLPVSFTTIMRDLLNDIANRDFSKRYILARDDGFSNATSNTYILTHITQNEEGGKIVSLTLSFNPASVINFYTLSFDANGGVEVTTQKPIEHNTRIGLLPTTTRTGYHGLVWNIDGTPISNNTVYTWNEDKTAVASWVINTYRIKFNGNGATGGTMDEQGATYGTSTTLTPNAFTRAGYNFVGWAMLPNGGVIYEDEASVLNLTSENDGVVNLYAVWEANTYTLTAVNGTVVGTFEITYGQTIGNVLKNIYNENSYGWNSGLFDKWTIDDETVTPDTVWTYTEDKSAIANWLLPTLKVQFKASGITAGDFTMPVRGYRKTSPLYDGPFIKVLVNQAVSISLVSVYDNEEFDYPVYSDGWLEDPDNIQVRQFAFVDPIDTTSAFYTWLMANATIIS